MNCWLVSHSNGLLKLAVGTPAHNDAIVPDADRQCRERVGGGVLKGG